MQQSVDNNEAQGSRSDNEQTQSSGKLADLVSTKSNAGSSQTEGEPIKNTEQKSNLEVKSDEECKVFKCRKCPKAITRKVMLKNHHLVHNTQRSFICETCKKRFLTRSALVRHIRTHTGEKPFSCNDCHKAFAQKNSLVHHLVIHSSAKPYQCQKCKKSYTQSEALKAHRCYQEIKALQQCELRSKAFTYASGLSRHLVTHTGKTFKCVECEKSFKDKSSYLRHYRIHARKEAKIYNFDFFFFLCIILVWILIKFTTI